MPQNDGTLPYRVRDVADTADIFRLAPQGAVPDRKDVVMGLGYASHTSPDDIVRCSDDGLRRDENLVIAQAGTASPPCRCSLSRNVETKNARQCLAFFLSPTADQSTHTRALRNMRSQPPSSCHSSGRQEFCTARNTRSGCGIMMVTRPSRLVRPVIPRGEPLGLAG